MWYVAKKEIKWFLKNPIYYIGTILILIFIYFDCSPYLNIKYFDSDTVITDLSKEKLGDAEFYDGYLPTTKEEQYELGIQNMKNDLLNELMLDEKIVEDIIETIRNKQMTIEEIETYMRENYSLKKAQFYFSNDMKKSTVNELNHYLTEKMKEQNYTSYMARKFSEYLGIYIVIYCMIILAILCINDYKKDMYELLHTKPLKSWDYIWGKGIGGILSILLSVGIITLFFNILTCITGIKNNLPVNFFELWFYVIICNLPIIIYFVFTYIFLSGIFKTPLPVIPILIIQLIYSNLGKTNELGVYEYKNKLFTILVRFSSKFLETSIHDINFWNQGILLLISGIFVLAAIYQWNRRTLI